MITINVFMLLHILARIIRTLKRLQLAREKHQIRQQHVKVNFGKTLNNQQKRRIKCALVEALLIELFFNSAVFDDGLVNNFVAISVDDNFSVMDNTAFFQ